MSAWEEVLATVWQVHDVRDVESFLHWRLGTLPAYNALNAVGKEDAFAAMLEAVVVMQQQHDPTDPISFSSKLGRAIPNRFIDYLRRYVADHRYEAERNADVFLTDDHSFFDGEYHDDIDDGDDGIDHIDIDGLTDEGRATLFDLALPLKRGAYIHDLAELHDMSAARIRKRLKSLALEVNPW